MKNINMKKLAIIAGMFMVFAAVMLVLNHSAKNGRETIERLPSIPDSPIYVECIPNETLEAKLTMKEDLTISGLQVLLVNLASESRGSLHVSMKDAQQKI